MCARARAGGLQSFEGCSARQSGRLPRPDFVLNPDGGMSVIKAKKAPAVGGTAGASTKPARKEGRNCAH